MKKNSIEELEIFHDSMNLADKIWHLVIDWPQFPKRALGYQLIKASDSIATNISEGYGRFFFKENRQCCYIARGSLFETKTFIIKSKNRQILSLKEYTLLMEQIEILIKKLNNYIHTIEHQIQTNY